MKNLFLLITIFLFLFKLSDAQSGKLDPSFGTNGIVKADLGSSYDYGFGMREVLVKSDGTMHVVFERGGQTLFSKRFSNGLVDSSFGVNGFSAAVDIIDEHAVLQPDGKIVVAGSSNFGNSRNFVVARFNADGSLDKSFSKDGKQTTHFEEDAYVKTVAIQGDGKIVVAGYTPILDEMGESYSDFALVRYNTDGSLDKSFSDDGMLISSVSYADDIPTSMVIQADGKIVVAGYSSINEQYEKYSFCSIARYNTDGSIDKSFSIDANSFGFLYVYPNSVALQNDGKIVIAGQSLTSLDEYNETTTTDIFVARYNTNGKLDSTFSDNGWQSTDLGSDNYDNATGVKLQKNGKIVVVGSTWNGINNDFVLARYNIDGSVDRSFGLNGLQKTDFGNTEEIASVLLIRSDGKIVVAGNSNGTEFALAHYNIDGSLDNSFDGDGKFTQNFRFTHQGRTNYTSTAIQNDGKMIAAGNSWNGRNIDFLVVRYNTDGSLDTTFNHEGMKVVNFGVFADGATSVVIQSDGKIVAGGYTSDQDGSHFALVRLNKNGTIDSTFAEDGTPELDKTQLGRINALSIQNDGKILAAGSLWNGSNNDFGLVRYNTNGTIDNTFGSFGIKKTDFGSTEDKATAMDLQADGKIMVAGVCSAYSDTKFYVIRYNTDGSIDSTYSNMATIGDNDGVNSIAIQSDQKIVIGGSLHSPSEYSQEESDRSNSNYAIARFNTNGSLDNTFSDDGITIIDVLDDDVVNAIVVQRNGKIIAGGSSNNTISLIALNTNGTLDSTFGNNGMVTTEASTSFNTIRGMEIYNNKLYIAGYGQYPGNFGLAARYLLDDTLMAPVVSITTPVNDTVYSGPASIKIRAVASDADGTISKVEFYNGTVLLHTEYEFPYGFTWNNVPVGKYTLTVKATDNSGLIATSGLVRVSVVPHKAPTVSIINPANNESFAGPATISLVAVANDPEGKISKVEFYKGTTLLSTKTASPYSYDWKDVPAGKYTITAKATNSFGLVTMSAAVYISVQANKAPTVSITNLANYQTFTGPASILMVAEAKDPDGAISKVEFYNGTTLLNTQYLSRYGYRWKNVPAGTYTITAKATDNLGLSKTSAPIKIIVTAPDTPIVNSRKPLINDLTGINKGVSIKLWPNPASNTLNIVSNGLVQNKQTTVSVISVSGVVMKTMQLYSKNQSIQLDVSSLASGVYTIKCICGDKVIYKQFIKL